MAINPIKAALLQCRRWVLAPAFFLALVPAQAQSVFFDNFSGCTDTGPTVTVNTALALATPIRVVVGGPGLVVCPGWTFSGEAYLAKYDSGTVFPAGATQAIWLNENNKPGSSKGRITRTLTGLVVNHTYEVSAQVWTDDIDAPTGLGVDFGSETLNVPLVAGSGPQSVSTQVCAKSPTLTLSLYENGTTSSSPVLTNLRVTDMGVCGSAVPVPVSAPWMLALLSALLALGFALRRKFGHVDR